MFPRGSTWLALATLAACGRAPHDVGFACDDDADCETGECYADSDPGYCTALCEDEGSTSQCPESTVCKRIEGGPARCLLLCEDAGDCPDNSECNAVPDSDGLRGCEPVF